MTLTMTVMTTVRMSDRLLCSTAFMMVVARLRPVLIEMLTLLTNSMKVTLIVMSAQMMDEPKYVEMPDGLRNTGPTVLMTMNSVTRKIRSASLCVPRSPPIPLTDHIFLSILPFDRDPLINRWLRSTLILFFRCRRC